MVKTENTKISELSRITGNVCFCLGPVMKPSNILSVLLYRAL